MVTAVVLPYAAPLSLTGSWLERDDLIIGVRRDGE